MPASFKHRQASLNAAAHMFGGIIPKFAAFTWEVLHWLPVLLEVNVVNLCTTLLLGQLLQIICNSVYALPGHSTFLLAARDLLVVLRKHIQRYCSVLSSLDCSFTTVP